LVSRGDTNGGCEGTPCPRLHPASSPLFRLTKIPAVIKRWMIRFKRRPIARLGRKCFMTSV
jgi:hypothetical protein